MNRDEIDASVDLFRVLAAVLRESLGQRRQA